MKISFLIPTKDRLSLLRNTIASILDQGATDIEIIISDNASTEDYRSYVAGLADNRIVYVRQPRSVSVTENWQKALSLATGSYVLMLGDDDTLTPDFMARLRPYLSTDGPELIYVAGYHYCYPNVSGITRRVPRVGAQFRVPAGQERAVRAGSRLCARARRIGRQVSSAFRHERSALRAKDVVRAFVREDRRPLSKPLSRYVRGGCGTDARDVDHRDPEKACDYRHLAEVFRGLLFLRPADEGYRFLDNEHVDAAVRESLKDVILPGDRNNTNWLVAVASACAALPGVVKSEVGTARYRALQILGVLSDSHLRHQSRFLDELRARLSEPELLLVDMIEAGLKPLARNAQALQKNFDAMTAQLRQYERGVRPAGKHRFHPNRRCRYRPR